MNLSVTGIRRVAPAGIVAVAPRPRPDQSITTANGQVSFSAHGETLWACDTDNDGRGVRAHLYWNGTNKVDVKCTSEPWTVRRLMDQAEAPGRAFGAGPLRRTG